MQLLIIAGFLLGFVAVIAAIARAMSRRKPRTSAGIYLSLVVTGAAICAFTTFSYTYFANSNTRVHGWPVPTVIFQREDAESPWLDFVGPTMVLAYPMNLILFLVVPSLLFLAWDRLMRHPEREAEVGDGDAPKRPC